MYFHGILGTGHGTFARLDHLVLQAGIGHDHAFYGSILSQEGCSSSGVGSSHLSLNRLLLGRHFFLVGLHFRADFFLGHARL